MTALLYNEVNEQELHENVNIGISNCCASQTVNVVCIKRHVSVIRDYKTSDLADKRDEPRELARNQRRAVNELRSRAREESVDE